MTSEAAVRPIAARNREIGPSKRIVSRPEIMNNPRSERLLFPQRATRPGPVQPRLDSRATTGGQSSTIPASAVPSVSQESLFLTSLPVIDEVTLSVCRRHRLSSPEAEDFAAEVHLHFLERNSEVLRRFEGRSSLRTFLSVVISRLLLDYRNRLWGKWRPSAEARRLGPTAMLVERLVSRDEWTLEQALEMLRINHQVTINGALLAFCQRLSARGPGRQFVSESEAHQVESGTPSPEANVLNAEQDFIAKRVRTVLGRVLQALVPEERLILKMRFYDAVPVADIARALHLDQKRLYRTIERLLAELRELLKTEGISRDDIDWFDGGVLGWSDDRDPSSGGGSDPSSSGGSGAAPAELPAETARTRWQQKR
jgi:RNA polymerase sigma factor (sigma-70 family)